MIIARGLVALVRGSARTVAWARKYASFQRVLYRRTRRFHASVVALVASLIAFPALAAQVSLAWDPSPAPTVTGYYLYYGVASQTYTSQIDVGNQTTYTVSNLTAGQTYFFSVTAYDAARNESAHSNEASVTIAGPPAAQTSLASSLNPASLGAERHLHRQRYRDRARPVPSISATAGVRSAAARRRPLRHRQHPHRDLHHHEPDHRHAQHRRQLYG